MKKGTARRSGAKTGFTLLELLVVVLIIGILSAVALPQYTKTVERARAGEALINLQAFADAVNRFWLVNGTYNYVTTATGQVITGVVKHKTDIDVPREGWFGYRVATTGPTDAYVDAVRGDFQNGVFTEKQANNGYQVRFFVQEGVVKYRFCQNHTMNQVNTCKQIFTVEDHGSNSSCKYSASDNTIPEESRVCFIKN